MPSIEEQIKESVAGINKGLTDVMADLEPKIKQGEEAQKGVADLKEQVQTISKDVEKKVDELLVLKQKEIEERQDKFETEMAEKLRKSAAFKGRPETPGIVCFNAATRKENPIDLTEITKSRGSRKIALKSWRLSADDRRSYPLLTGDVPGDMKAITNADASAGDAVDYMRVPGIVRPGEQPLLIRDLLPIGRTSSDLVRFVRESAVTDAAGIQAGQGADKGESDFDFAAASEEVETIATYVIASTQILQDAVGLQSYLDSRVRFLVLLVEDNQLLNGDGTTNNLNGLITQATAFNAGLLTNLGVASATDLDTLRAAILQVTLANFPATGIVLPPFNWASIELTKDSQNRYIFTNPQNTTAPRIWGLPVVPSQSAPDGEFLVGAFSLGAQVWDRMDAAVQFSTEDSDNFRKNLVTIRAEERLALTVYRPTSFVTGALANAQGSGS